MRYCIDCFVCGEKILANHNHTRDARGVRHLKCEAPPNLVPSLRLAARLRENRPALAAALRNFAIGPAETSAVAKQPPADVCAWLTANRDRKTSGAGWAYLVMHAGTTL